MEVRNCRGCGKLYNYIGGPYRNLCPNCIEKIEEKYLEVKEYIQDHHNATMTEVAEECDVSTRQIEQWIRDERLVIADDSPIGITCERCGASIKSGRFCERCKNKMANNRKIFIQRQSCIIGNTPFPHRNIRNFRIVQITNFSVPT